MKNTLEKNDYLLPCSYFKNNIRFKVKPKSN